jgi:hypothetical protein
MKRKLMWLTAIGAVVAVAYAQSVIVRGAYGLGFASGSNAERPDALFHFSVRQVEANGEIRNSGFFSIEAYSATGVVHVYIPRVRDIEVNMSERKAQFSGPAIAVDRSRPVVRWQQGVAKVEVVDNSPRPRPDSTPDTIRVDFYLPETSEPAFTYTGAARRGDLVVYEISATLER